MSMKDKLSPKQRRFVAEYLKDHNGNRAAISAGYSKKTARFQASDLLTRPNIAAAIDSKLTKIEEKVLVDKEFIIGGLKEVSERCMTRVPVMEFDHQAKEMVEKKTYIEDPDHPGKMKMVGVYEFDSSGANRSLELLGKHLGLFTERIFVADSLEKLLAASNPPVEK